MNFLNNPPHLFHIPVMGTGFSIDTPLRVAKYGISSVVSLTDDILIEQMRKYHYAKLNRKYEEISENGNNSRAERITAYLDFIDEQVREQVNTLRSEPFEPESDITRYFEMLPDSSLRQEYLDMLAETDQRKKQQQQQVLRQKVVPGSIDVNIMTKLDRDVYRRGTKLAPEFSDAMAALRGYATSSLQSSVIFSAGINPRLFSYLAMFDDFLPDETGKLKKKIVLKVSDFRSAIIQGKYLAKRGLWVSEYRIESGLNCGGHAFATDGYLTGPILEEFKNRKTELADVLHKFYNKALVELKRAPLQEPQNIRITMQGGIGTAEEQKFLLEYYGINSTGWGTPFLLVPEVTNVDDVHLEKLVAARDNNDVYLSDRSPLGVPFWILRKSASEEIHARRIGLNKPGSPCPKGFLISNTEFTDMPLCHASRTYQKKKLRQLAENNLPLQQVKRDEESITVKSCICHDVAGSAILKYHLEKEAHPAICCGPNIVNFNRIFSLDEMVSHIYGRLSLITNPDRPHMFIKELTIYIDYLRRELQRTSEGLVDRTAKYFLNFKQNLNSAIEYYRNLAEQFSAEQKERFLQDLNKLFSEMENILPEKAVPATMGVTL